MPWSKFHGTKKRSTSNDREYEKTYRSTGALAVAATLRRGSRWKKCREMYLDESPLCQDPFGDHSRYGQVVAAEEVHHKIAVVDNPNKAFEVNNLAGLCTSCHARIEALVRTGKKEELKIIWDSVDQHPHPQQP